MAERVKLQDIRIQATDWGAVVRHVVHEMMRASAEDNLRLEMEALWKNAADVDLKINRLIVQAQKRKEEGERVRKLAETKRKRTEEASQKEVKKRKANEDSQKEPHTA